MSAGARAAAAAAGKPGNSCEMVLDLAWVALLRIVHVFGVKLESSRDWKIG